jgi:DNA helicase-4
MFPAEAYVIPDRAFPDALVAVVADFIGHRIALRQSLDGLDGDWAWIEGIVRDLQNGSRDDVMRCRAALDSSLGPAARSAGVLVPLVTAANSMAITAVHDQRRRRAEDEREVHEQRQRRAAARAERARERERLVGIARAALAVDYVHPEAHAIDAGGAAALPAQVWRAARSAFVADWALASLDLHLDREQAAAVGSLAPELKVVARAGSGKTRVLVARALFLQQVCGVDPDAILMLVFNVNAREEMEERLRVGGGPLPHVMTFHALAYALVHDGKQLLRDDERTHDRSQTAVIEDAIAEILKSDDEMRQVRKLMDIYFREDLQRFLAGGLHHSAQAGLEERYELRQESLRGDFVKSFGEKWIANTLLEFGVPYAYEAAHDWDNATYRPDFTIWSGNVALEYFGMAGDPGYDEQTAAKRAYWAARPDWTIVEVHRADVGDERQLGLIEKLNAAGIQTRRLTEEELWQRCREHFLKRFSGAMAQIVNRAKAEGIGAESLIAKGNSLGTEVDALIGVAAGNVLGAYEALCEARRLEDHSGQIWQASNLIASGHTTLRRRNGEEAVELTSVRHVLIDELQDFTAGFRSIVAAVRDAVPGVNIFGVGDDWQSINRFAGADPELFIVNEGPIDGGERTTIRTNYRSARGIVDAGNRVMDGRGVKAVAASAESGGVSVVYREDVTVRPAEEVAFGRDPLLAALARIVWDRTARGSRVALLSRVQRAPWLRRVDNVRRVWDLAAYLGEFLPTDRRQLISGSTVHGYKGQEADVVIMLDVRASRYPLRHPHWVFGRILGDTLISVDDDERRLFYVGITRGQRETILMSERANVSEYLESLQRDRPLPVLDVGRLHTPPVLGAGKEALRVPNGYAIKEELKARGFRFDGSAREWCLIGVGVDLEPVEAWLSTVGTSFYRGSAG